MRKSYNRGRSGRKSSKRRSSKTIKGYRPTRGGIRL